MFKKFVVSLILGVSLFSSVFLWAKNSDVPTVAKLDVEQQLSISAHKTGDDQFAKKVSSDQDASILKEKVRVPLMSVLGLLVFGLMYFVLRSSRQRVK